MSGFVRRRRVINIKGTHLSLHSGQSIVSSGNPSLDHVFGGGFPVGSIIGIGEDKYGSYSRVLTKYFLAEGIVNYHGLFLATMEEDAQQLIHKLPTAVQEKSSPANQDAQAPENMRIAFRYNQLAPVDSVQMPSTMIGHYFDLSKAIDPSALVEQDLTCWNGEEVPERDLKYRSFKNPDFASLLTNIHRKASEPTFNASTEDGDKNLLRICLNSIGSPAWYDQSFGQDFLRFLALLKTIVRNTLSVCLITVPFHLFQHLEDAHLSKKVMNLLDFSFDLEAFAGQTDDHANSAYKEYHGLLNITKITPFNSLSPFNPETRDLAFKLKRSKFVIEKLHLPPDIADDDGHNKRPVPTMSCSGGGTKNKLDF